MHDDRLRLRLIACDVRVGHSGAFALHHGVRLFARNLCHKRRIPVRDALFVGTKTVPESGPSLAAVRSASLRHAAVLPPFLENVSRQIESFPKFR